MLGETSYPWWLFITNIRVSFCLAKCVSQNHSPSCHIVRRNFLPKLFSLFHDGFNITLCLVFVFPSPQCFLGSPLTIPSQIFCQRNDTQDERAKLNAMFFFFRWNTIFALFYINKNNFEPERKLCLCQYHWKNTWNTNFGRERISRRTREINRDGREWETLCSIHVIRGINCRYYDYLFNINGFGDNEVEA